MEFCNKYWVLRHGRSMPNEKGLIVSHLNNGILAEHGLSPVGIDQSRAAGCRFLKTIPGEGYQKPFGYVMFINMELEAENIMIDTVRLYCSPFSRTIDTAKAVADVMGLNTSKFQYHEDLRERYFGPALELQSHEHYPKIWALDEHNPLVGPDGGESVADVAARLVKVIQQIETECQGAAVLVVSHGDPLQIMQTIFSTADKGTDCRNGAMKADIIDPVILAQHRKFALSTGELRRVI